jgi:hypothetical protein
MSPKFWEQSVRNFYTLRDAGLRVSAKTLLEDFGKDNQGPLGDYSPQQLDWIASNQNTLDTIRIKYKNGSTETASPAKLLAKSETDFRGFTCNNPQEVVYVGMSGEVFTTACKQRRQLGSIHDLKNLNIDNEPIKCYTERCWCYSDLHTKKTRLGE